MASCGKPPQALKAVWSLEQERIAALREPDDRLSFEVREVRDDGGDTEQKKSRSDVGKSRGDVGKFQKSSKSRAAAAATGAGKAKQWRVKLPEATRHEFPGLKRVAGVDLSFFPDSRYAVAAVVVVSYPDMSVLFEHCATLELSVPYIPGYLAFREVPALAAILRGVDETIRPDVVLVDGNGAFHPRQAGAATHLGVVTGLPTVGVAKDVMRVSTFCKTRALEIGRRFERPGDWAYFTDQDELTTQGREKTIPLAALVRPGSGQKSLVVSSGHRVSLPTAVALVRAMCPSSVPEPIRLADKISRQAVSSWLGGTRLPDLALGRRSGKAGSDALDPSKNSDSSNDGSSAKNGSSSNDSKASKSSHTGSKKDKDAEHPEPGPLESEAATLTAGVGGRLQQQQQQQQRKEEEDEEEEQQQQQQQQQQTEQLAAAKGQVAKKRPIVETIAKFDGPGSEDLKALLKILPTVHAPRPQAEAPRKKKWRVVTPADQPAPPTRPDSCSETSTQATAAPRAEEAIENGDFAKAEALATKAQDASQEEKSSRSDCCFMSFFACWQSISGLLLPFPTGARKC